VRYSLFEEKSRDEWREILDREQSGANVNVVRGSDLLATPRLLV